MFLWLTVALWTGRACLCSEVVIRMFFNTNANQGTSSSRVINTPSPPPSPVSSAGLHICSSRSFILSASFLLFWSHSTLPVTERQCRPESDLVVILCGCVCLIIQDRTTGCDNQTLTARAERFCYLSEICCDVIITPPPPFNISCISEVKLHVICFLWKVLETEEYSHQMSHIMH